MPLHFAWTQYLQLRQKIEFLPTPFRHTPQGNFQDLFWVFWSYRDTITTFVFPLLTLGPFCSIPVFQLSNFLSSSSILSAISTRSSAYSSSQGSPVLNTLESASKTMLNSRGLKTEPWCTLPSQWSLLLQFHSCLQLIHWHHHSDEPFLYYSRLSFFI